MGSRVKNERLQIGGMSCVSCQYKIEKKLRYTAGVQSAKVDYRTGIADIAYDADIVSRADIVKVIEKLGYQALPASEKTMMGVGRVAGILAIIVALYMLLQGIGLLNLLAPGQLADTSMGYGMLFVIGLITSVHCVAMCGGINLSQCVPKSAPPKQPQAAGESQTAFSAFAPAILYNLGRVLSYTAIGFYPGPRGDALWRRGRHGPVTHGPGASQDRGRRVHGDYGDQYSGPLSVPAPIAAPHARLPGPEDQRG